MLLSWSCETSADCDRNERYVHSLLISLIFEKENRGIVDEDWLYEVKIRVSSSGLPWDASRL